MVYLDREENSFKASQYYGLHSRANIVQPAAKCSIILEAKAQVGLLRVKSDCRSLWSVL